MPESPSRPCVSFVVVNWNAKDHLPPLIESIPAAMGAQTFEVIVVDNASTDGSQALLRAEFPTVQTIESETNLGYARANNVGIARAEGEFVALVNPDVILSPLAMARLVEFLKEHERAGVVGPKSLKPNGQPHNYKLEGPTALNAILAFPGISHVTRAVRQQLRREPAQLTEPVQCDHVHGSCMVLRKATLQEIGLMPVETFMYGEEILLGHALRGKNYEVWYDPQVAVVHQDGVSSTQRWDNPKKAAAIRMGLVRAAQRVLSPLHYALWNLVMLLSASVRFLFDALRASPSQATQRRYLQIHSAALLGKPFGGAANA